MFINLTTTRTSGGWMYFKINNTSYMRLSGSGTNINMYKDTAISGNLHVGVSAATPYIKTSAANGRDTSYCELKATNRDHGKLRFNTNYSHGTVYVCTDSNNFFRLTNCNNEINFINRQQELQMTDLKKTKN